jgi:uncharacterized membrane protein
MLEASNGPQAPRAVQAVKDKKMGFLVDLLVRVLHSISSRALIVTRNYFVILTPVENYVIILHIFFKDDHFFFIINKTFVLTVDPCFS